jgi:hypothetical protein
MLDFPRQEIFFARTGPKGQGLKIMNFEKEKYCSASWCLCFMYFFP